MYQRLFVTVLFIGLLHAIPHAIGEPAIPFVDGRWKGGINFGPDNKVIEECWASKTFSDGTAFTLAERSNVIWHLRLSNPGWRLSPDRRYSMVARIDFYPQLRIAAEAKSQASLEIANLDQISLLGLIENGHTIDLTSEGFNAKYDLEGSAKVIARIRSCFADEPVAERN
jgi:hypothetical protein